MSARSCRIWLLCVVLLPIGGRVRSADEPAKPPEVPVARPVSREVTDYEDFTGRADASASVEVRARVTGYVVKTAFQEGGEVKQGDLLFEIDPRPYQAQLDQALSQVELHKASLKLARVTLARDQAVAKQAPGSITQQQLDQDQAAVEEALARLKAYEAATEVYKLNLSFCKITAPISGKIGRALVTPGNLVNQDQTLLAVLVSEKPTHVYFDVDERTLLRLLDLMRKDRLEDRKLPVVVGLAGEEGFPHSGVVNFIDNQFDPKSGAIRLRAVLANKDGRMVPGMFVRVRLAMGAPRKALLVVDRAIGSDQGLKYVYVVDVDNKVQYRRVTVGPMQPDGLRVIEQGLKPDDRLVVGPLSGLRPKMTIRPELVEMPALKDQELSGEAPSPRGAIPSPRGHTGSGIGVEATYPGASAEIVSETVRAPIEEQVSGLEKVRYLRSRCTSDGKYALTVSFAPGVDLWREQVLVQNRVSLALPVLPAAVQNAGIHVQRGTSGVLLFVNLFSPDDRYDTLYLSNFARIWVKDELSRLAGVGEVSLLSSHDYMMRAWLDPDKLAALNLSATDVAGALAQQNLQVVPLIGEQPVPKGLQFRLTFDTLGRLASPEEFADIIVKSGDKGQVIHLRDIARVELGANRPRSLALLDGKPVATLVVRLTGEVSARKVNVAVRERLAALRDRFPEGLDYEANFDFTANLEGAGPPAASEYVLVDLDLLATTVERTARILNQSEQLLRQVPGVRHVLAFSENPFDPFGGPPCLLVLLNFAEQRKTTREEIAKTIRTQLGKIEEGTVRLRDFSAPGSFPRCGYPINLALHGLGGHQQRSRPGGTWPSRR